VLSLGIGYLVAGRVLAPVSRITARARELGAAAPDLSGRIALGGPDDELKELADTLDGFLDRLEAAMAGQRRFLADASHELRTPLAAAQATLDVVLADPDADVDEHRHAAGVAGSQLRRMGRLVSDLLVLERRSGSRPAVVDLQATAAEVARELAPLAEERGVSLQVRPGARASVEADPDDLRRIAANLMENAVIHNRPGGRAEAWIERTGGWVRLIVADNGPGIAPDDQERIFERFARAADGPGGTGLGLAIVRELAWAAGGEVALASRPGAGSAFAVSLPALR
jgi:signal transduction histidine kinase